MSHLEKEKQKLIARIKRIRGQVDSIERSLTTDDDCADVLMLLANVRGGINSLMAEVLEDHIRLHMLGNEKNSMPAAELAEDLIGLVRAYLKQVHGTARRRKGSYQASCIGHGPLYPSSMHISWLPSYELDHAPTTYRSFL